MCSFNAISILLIPRRFSVKQFLDLVDVIGITISAELLHINVVLLSKSNSTTSLHDEIFY